MKIVTSNPAEDSIDHQELAVQSRGAVIDLFRENFRSLFLDPCQTLQNRDRHYRLIDAVLGVRKDPYPNPPLEGICKRPFHDSVQNKIGILNIDRLRGAVESLHRHYMNVVIPQGLMIDNHGKTFARRGPEIIGKKS